MKYQFVNRLQDFEYHDSFWKLTAWEGDTLTFSVTHLNVRKAALEESVDTDMEIQEARVVFHGVFALTYEPSRAWKTDENGNAYTDEPRIVHEGAVVREFFVSELQKKPIIYNFYHGNGKCEMGGCGDDPYFTFCFSFREAEISWDAFKGPAWYARKRPPIEPVG